MNRITLLNRRVIDGADPVDIEIAGDRIIEIRTAGVGHAAGKPQDPTGVLLVPGFIGGHHHPHENYFKGRFEGQPLELVMNFARPLKPIV